MHRFPTMVSLAICAVAFLVGKAAAECHDVSGGKSLVLKGRLVHTIFPGAPEFEDVKKGDEPEAAYILELATPICVVGDEFISPQDSVQSVQLIPSGRARSEARQLADSQVVVVLTEPYGAHTMHHHAPLLGTVDEIWSDPTAERGTPGTVVKAFYWALSAGDGRTASSYVIPEKRTRGPLSAPELTQFYRSLSEPLKLVYVKQISRNRYLATYSFRNDGAFCNGRSEVVTVSRDGENLIESITALDGC